MFCCELYEIFENSLFIENLLATGSAGRFCNWGKRSGSYGTLVSIFHQISSCSL